MSRKIEQIRQALVPPVASVGAVTAVGNGTVTVGQQTVSAGGLVVRPGDRVRIAGGVVLGLVGGAVRVVSV